MLFRFLASIALGTLLGNSSGCVQPPPGDAPAAGGAVIVGRIVTDDATSKLLNAQGTGCPDVVVSLNGTPAQISFDDECGFLVSDIGPTTLLALRVELPDLGVAGTIEIDDVVDGELIEILVDTSDVSLGLTVVREVEPGPPVATLPTVITGNNVSLQIGRGVYRQGLLVDGNNFTLIGEAGDDCDDSNGWSVITGTVEVRKNNATFRNIRFDGAVEVRGNNARFINCCFGGELLAFGNNLNIDRVNDDEGDD